MYLTKSDFITARTCPTKLYFKKLHCPSLRDDDPYMEFLADGGFMVEKMAKLLYPDGREIGGWDNPPEAFAATKKALPDRFYSPSRIHLGTLHSDYEGRSRIPPVAPRLVFRVPLDEFNEFIHCAAVKSGRAAILLQFVWEY
jgi:hypothetical protein